MRVKELRALLGRHLDNEEVIIYNNGDFIVEDAWFDRGAGVFAIQVKAECGTLWCSLPAGHVGNCEERGEEQEEPKEPRGEEERRGSARVRLEQEMKDSGRW